MILCSRPHAHVAGRDVSWFHLGGAAGLGASVVVAVVAAELGDLPLGPVLSLTALGVGVFLALALTTKVVIGEERLTYYHHELAILACSALFLHASHRPVLAYLDVVAAGVGAFLVCGRIGCLLVGCCHGRPARNGIVYPEPHAEAGFPASHVGLPLVPVQLIEASAVGVIVITALWLQANGAGDGAALAVALVGYGAVRFMLEFLRGDIRPAAAGLTEAQWTSALISGFVSGATIAGTLAVPAVVPVAATAVVITAVSRIATNRGSRRDRRALRSARHVTQLLASVRDRPTAGGTVTVSTTSLGVIVSASGAAGRGAHWAISWPEHAVDESDGRWMATLIASAGGLDAGSLVTRRNGVVHLAEPLRMRDRSAEAARLGRLAPMTGTHQVRV